MDWLEIKEILNDTIKYVIFVVAVIFIAVYVIGLQQVVGSSMSPNLNNGDILILDKISYRFTDIKRGDVVSLYYADTKYLIKRVIGLPGEYIEFKDSKLYVNNKLVEEKYLNGVVTTNFSLKDLGYDKIPEDYYLVLGDNRGDSLDSRDPKVGLIKKEDIIGKVRFRIWPINEVSVIR